VDVDVLQLELLPGAKIVAVTLGPHVARIMMSAYWLGLMPILSSVTHALAAWSIDLVSLNFTSAQSQNLSATF